MSTFTDDFNRGDGGLGNNWQVVVGTQTISSNHASLSNATRSYNASISASGRHEALCTLSIAVAADMAAGALIKYDHIAGGGYTAYGTGTLASPTWVIRKTTLASISTLVSAGGSGISAGEHTTRLLWDAGMLYFWVDGAFIASFYDDAHASNSEAGMYAGAATASMNTFTLLGDETTTFSVSPTTIPNFGLPTTVTFTGVGTAWTSGTPGAPAFTVDHGTLSDQEVLSATSATATYTPGNFLGTARFTDPSTAAFDDVLVTSDVSVIPPNAGNLTSAVVTWLENQAAHGGLVVAEQQSGSETPTEGVYLKGAFGELLIGKRYTVGADPAPTPPSSLLQDIYARLWGGEEWQSTSFVSPGTDSLKEETAFLRERWATSVTPWTVDQLVTALGGDPLASHQDILTALDGLEVSTDLQPVLDAIAAAQGDPLATIKAAIDLVYALGTVNNYTLGSVRTWVESVRGSGQPDLAQLVTKLGQIQPSTGVTLSSLNTQGVDLQQLLDTLALVIGVVAPEAGTVAELIALIYDAVTAAAPAAATVGPPVWIDEEHATIDSPIALSDGLIIEGPLDGVLVTITGSPSGATKFTFGDTDSWRYVGAVIFETDRGDAEWSQPIGLEAQIVTPRTMQHAAAARFRVSSGWTGTVSAFTVTAGA